MNRKIAYIISDTDKSLEFEWTAFHLTKKSVLQFIILGKTDTPLIRYLKNINVPVFVITDEAYPSSFAKLFKVWLMLWQEKVDVVHCHLWRASLIGLLAAYMSGVKKRIFARHHSVIHYYEFKKGRKWDRFCNWLATDIVAISENVKKVLEDLDKAQSKKIHVIHHGFELDYFSSVNDERVAKIKQRYIFESRSPVIGVISRYLELKGIQYIIPAFQKLLKTFPAAHLVLANARGDYQTSINELLKELPGNSYTEILFESDLAALYKSFDVFIHAPIDPQREAFGQTYVEALASGIPSVFTLSGVAPEFIVHETNALVVPFCDSGSIHQSILRILHDEELRNHLIANGKQSVNRFPMSKMIDQLSQLYAS